ncbi:MAG: family 10 glycosylhydrolase [Chloroflexi bacterium]|nr:family 10 glycosylhydrolase [Chloroflexota bacterium]
MSTAGTAHIGDLGLSQPPIYLTNLDRCQPADALSSESKTGRWRAFAYSTADLSGTLLYAGDNTAAPEVTLPLGVSGWHAISIGQMVHDHELYEWSGNLLAKLSGERGFTNMHLPPRINPQPGGGVLLAETFFKIADLTGQDMQFKQIAVSADVNQPDGICDCEPARPAYVKLVPLTDSEVAALKADRARTDTKRLYAHDDNHGWMGHIRAHTPEDVQGHLEPYRNTDFERIYLETGGGDLLNYFTKIARDHTLDAHEDFSHVGYRKQSEAWRIFRDQGVDPYDVAIEHAHDMGLEIHASWRVTGFHYPPPNDHFNSGDGVFEAHPEWRSVDREGRITPRLSYAYPGFRAFAISLLREMAEKPVDGVCLLYNRRPPFTEYEPHIVEAFKAASGHDPRELDEHDPDWLRFRARVMTDFMRELRAGLAEVAAATGRDKPISVSAIVMKDEAENLHRALDLQAWVSEGLIDTIIPYTSAPELNSRVPAWDEPERQLEFFLDLVRDTPVELAASVLPRSMTPEEYQHAAARIYRTGVERLFFWDCTTAHDSFKGLRSLGHREDVEAWHAAGKPDLSAPQHTLTTLGDWDFSYDTPG